MPKSNPAPQPLPTEGGAYLLNVSTGEWVRQDSSEAPAAAEPEPIAESQNGTLSETPPAGED